MPITLPQLDTINSILWGPWTPFVLLATGVLFTVWTRFIQYTVMTHGIDVVRGAYDDPSDEGAISHFQALSAALSATVGLGNIGGVALAVGVGGPGAIFWMWVVGVLGMALKAIEITLAMLYRDTSDPDDPSGGAMWVVEQVLGSKGGAWKGIARLIGGFFCVTLVIATFTSGNMFQSWSVAELTEINFGFPKVASGIVLAVIVGMVIIGGIKRIGRVAGKLVPLMCVLYLVSGLVVLAVNVTEIPSLFALIFTSAFQPTEAAGAFLGGGAGWAFIQGMKRAFFSNEAGLGSAPIAHAAAKTGHPAREGIVGGLGPFIDTLCICTLTGLVILATETWNREAVGAFSGSVSIERVAINVTDDTTYDATKTYRVVTSGDISQLPEDETKEWGVGSRFYLVGRAEGNAQLRATGSGAIKLTGEIVNDADALSVEWQPIVIEPNAWDGTVDELVLDSRDLYREYDGAELTSLAFDRQFPGLGRWLVTLAAWLFALSSMISWSYYGEQGMIYLLGRRSILPFQVVFLIGTIYAANWIEDADHMMKLMDLGTGAMLWSNIPIVIVLGYLAVGSLKTYRQDLRAGKFPRHESQTFTEMTD